jgi:hypothetical protein
MSLAARQYAEARFSWLYTWDTAVYYKYMDILEASDELLDTQIQGLVDTVITWKDQWTVSKIESLMTMFYQGRVLGVDIGTFNGTFSINGFFNHMSNLPSSYKYLSMSELDPTNPEIAWWVNHITNTATDKANLDSIESAIHGASTHYVYTATFRPSHLPQLPVQANGLKDDILFTRGYSKLYQVLNVYVTVPDY